ncbi:hypothetical protein BDQ17DRAFT_342717 [Cyathus striatus]|nr:hypothetical protein BDQ17DRAFT_342717 [Cyathus striatus]
MTRADSSSRQPLRNAYTSPLAFYPLSSLLLLLQPSHPRITFTYSPDSPTSNLEPRTMELWRILVIRGSLSSSSDVSRDTFMRQSYSLEGLEPMPGFGVWCVWPQGRPSIVCGALCVSRSNKLYFLLMRKPFSSTSSLRGNFIGRGRQGQRLQVRMLMDDGHYETYTSTWAFLLHRLSYKAPPLSFSSALSYHEPRITHPVGLQSLYVEPWSYSVLWSSGDTLSSSRDVSSDMIMSHSSRWLRAYGWLRCMVHVHTAAGTTGSSQRAVHVSRATDRTLDNEQLMRRLYCGGYPQARSMVMLEGQRSQGRTLMNDTEPTITTKCTLLMAFSPLSTLLPPPPASANLAIPCITFTCSPDS